MHGWINIGYALHTLSIQRFDDESYCSPFKTKIQLRDIAMQRQPTPRIDPNRPGLFLRRNDALHIYSNQPTTLNYMSDITSMHTTDNKVIEARKVNTARDVEVKNNLKLRIWYTKKVKGILKCFNCNKPRCYFS